MTRPGVARFALRARLALTRIGAPACVVVLLCASGVAGWMWVLRQRVDGAPLPPPLPALSAPPPLATAPPPIAPGENLARFYAALGARRHAERHVATLFALAAKNGLMLKQGDYSAGYEQASRVHTYHIVLPVKGEYRAIWQFAWQTLRALPFAALDDISFRREAIGEATLEARLRLTLYLTDAAAATAP